MSVRIYPVTRTCLECDDYTVKINGEKLDLTQRVSRHTHLTGDGRGISGRLNRQSWLISCLSPLMGR